MVFQTSYDHFKYQIMLFNLLNALAIFQGYVNKILIKKLNVFCNCISKDILIYIKDLNQSHIEFICWFLDKFQKYSLFTNIKKCYFHQNEVHFLDYMVSSKDISIEAKKIKIVKD